MSIQRFYQVRDYQQEAIAQIAKALPKHKHILRQQPTGTGKSIEIAEGVIRAMEKGKKALVCAPAPHLVNQLERDARRLGFTPGIIQGNRTASGKDQLTIACIPSLVNRLDLFQTLPDIVFYDEVHHSKAATFSKVVQYFEQCYSIGYTATPTRLDGKGFDGQFDILIPGKPVQWFIDNGYLAPYRYISLPNLGYQLTGKSDRLDEQAKYYDNPTIVGNLVETWLREAEGLPTLGFAPTVEMSKHIVEAYNEMARERYGHPIAVHMDASTPDRVREFYLKNFGDTIKIIYNVDLFQEGLDLPNCSCVQLVRLTQSPSRCQQMWGRGLRYAPGKVCIFLDHVGLAEKHDLPNTPREWTLKGWLDPEKLKLYCVSCDGLMLEDKRTLKALSLECPHCKTLNVFEPKEKQDRTPGERGNYDKDESTQLVEINPRSQQLQIQRILKNREKQGNKPFWAVAKALKLQGLEAEDFFYLAQKLQYKPTYGQFLFKAYRVLWHLDQEHTNLLTFKELEAKIGQSAKLYERTYKEIWQNKN
jgi:superfamily II DNA or RNA helicase